MVSHFLNLLEDALDHPDRRVSALKLMSVEECEQLAYLWNEAWNDAQSYYPQDELVHELFELQVERQPEAIAIICEGEEITYAELNRRADRDRAFVCKGRVSDRKRWSASVWSGRLRWSSRCSAYSKLAAPLCLSTSRIRRNVSGFLLADTGVRLLLTKHIFWKNCRRSRARLCFRKQGELSLAQRYSFGGR